MIDYEEVFYLSYWRATQRTVDGVAFLDAFYDNFLATSPEIAKRFDPSRLDALKRMLAISIVHVAKYYPTQEPDTLLKVLAARHSRHDLDVRPELYEHWTAALLDTVKVFDSKFDDVTAEAWRRVLAPGVDYMKSRYDAPSEAPASDDT